MKVLSKNVVFFLHTFPDVFVLVCLFVCFFWHSSINYEMETCDAVLLLMFTVFECVITSGHVSVLCLQSTSIAPIT